MIRLLKLALPSVIVSLLTTFLALLVLSSIYPIERSQITFSNSKNSDFIQSSKTIPWDDTMPLNTEGAKIVELSVLPKTDSGCLIIDGLVHAVEESNTAKYIIVALFRDNQTEAISSSVEEVLRNYEAPDTDSLVTSIPLHHIIELRGESQIRLVLRAGLDQGTININGEKGSRKLGGILSSHLSVMEVGACQHQN